MLFHYYGQLLFADPFNIVLAAHFDVPKSIWSQYVLPQGADQLQFDDVCRLTPAQIEEFFFKVSSNSKNSYLFKSLYPLFPGQPIPLEFGKDRDFILNAVQKDRWALSYAANFRRDREIVLTAVKSCGSSLQFADPKSSKRSRNRP